jgi:hypothetical protein
MNLEKEEMESSWKASSEAMDTCGLLNSGKFSLSLFREPQYLRFGVLINLSVKFYERQP